MDENLFPGTPGAASYVALGDSFTEGLNDPAPCGGFRGWADRLAGMLAAEHEGLRYANLAVRGKLLRQIVHEQVPDAVALSPALVSLAGGGNDILRPSADPDTLAELFDAAVTRLIQAGSRVLIFTGSDPVRFPVLRLLRGRIAAYNMHLRAIADIRGCYLVDLWSMRFLRDAAAWSPDRLHLTAESHQRVALRASEVLGIPVADDWRVPRNDPGAIERAGAGALAPVGLAAAGSFAGQASVARYLAGLAPAGLAPASPAWLSARREDIRWAREYALPWVGRRLRGASSGDGLAPKRPSLQPVTPPIIM